MKTILNIYHICKGSRALGPGLRYVIWVQGCRQCCKGCISPESRPLKINKLFSIDDLAADIIATQGIDGITISGGEPFLQAEQLIGLIERVQATRPELNVLVFTGYTIEQLSTKTARFLLSHIDVLIDGPYIEELNVEIGLRGSSNQRIHFLTPRLLPFKEELEHGGRNNEIVVDPDGIQIIGIPSERYNDKGFYKE